MKRLWGVVVLLLVLAGCVNIDSDGAIGDGAGDEDPGNCTPIDSAVSSEKIALLTELARDFNGSDEAKLEGGGCAFVRVKSVSSGGAAQALASTWDTEAFGPEPVIWSPAAKSWGAVLNQRLSERGEDPMAPTNAQPFMLTPLVIAMPKPMADALGYPDTPVGYSDLLALARDPNGWASKGHPEWGAFKLGKTNPNFSTSALSATIAQYYAATGKTGGLTLEDVNRPEVADFNRGVESSVVHYGDITMTFLNNLFRADRSGSALTYVSAVAVEEKSVIDYNAGNPDGVLDAGEEPRKPRVPLVAIYPKEGTLFSDNPLFVLDAPWVDESEREGGEAFAEFVRRPENQKKVLDFGFRPGNPAVSVAEPITTDNGVDPAQPETTLGVPAPEVLVRIVDLWAEQRKSARVLLVLDVSGSMGEETSTGETKLDLAKQAAIEALELFKPEDEVGLRIFSTNVQQREPTDFLDLVPMGPIAGQREAIVQKLRNLSPIEGTPLYTTAQESYNELKESFAPDKINAVVLLTDGRNEDPRNNDLNGLLSNLRAGSEGQSSKPVRIFTIAFGEGADAATLGRIAEATNAASYNASDPATIDRVFIAVISNF